MRSGPTLSRRSAIAATGVAGLAVAGCSVGRHPSASQAPGTVKSPTANPKVAARLDAELRAGAIADERHLLGACAAPAGEEPFATLRTLHRRHLQFLTGTPISEPAGAAVKPAVAGLLLAERAATAARRSDCVRASASLAPLLASLAAAGDVAAELLAT